MRRTDLVRDADRAVRTATALPVAYGDPPRTGAWHAVRPAPTSKEIPA
ncbi:hypothetical protein ACFY4K_12785 [Streptomyces leeuwenhoekii]